MSAHLTSKKDLSTIAFIWSRIFADSKKASFENVVSNKDHAARLLEFNIDIENIIFELLIDANLDSLRSRYSQCRELSRGKLIDYWTSETMEYVDPKLEKINNKEIESLIGSYTYQSEQYDGFKTSYGFKICKMIIDKINEVLPVEFQDKKEGYAMTADRTYREDYGVCMTDEEYNEEYREQSTYNEEYDEQDDEQDDDAQEVDTSVFM
jgi:hypothetical protein